MTRAVDIIGFSAGAFIWVPLAGIVLGHVGPGISVATFWRSFTGGFLAIPAVIGAVILVVWIVQTIGRA